MKLSIKDLVILSLLAALMVAAQVALAGLPNVELVSLLVILYTLFFRKKALYSIYVFVLLEGFIYGFGIWWICYLYVWTILWGITMLLSKERNPIVWALISGLYGFTFGTLCSVPYFFISGIRGGIAWIISGLFWDLVHGVGNLVVALVLFRPLYYSLTRICRGSSAAGTNA